MFNMKLEEKPHKMSFKVYSLKYSGQKTDKGGTMCPPLPWGS